jgi:hypothetical protein
MKEFSISDWESGYEIRTRNGRKVIRLVRFTGVKWEFFGQVEGEPEVIAWKQNGRWRSIDDERSEMDLVVWSGGDRPGSDSTYEWNIGYWFTRALSMMNEIVNAPEEKRKPMLKAFAWQINWVSKRLWSGKWDRETVERIWEEHMIVQVNELLDRINSEQHVGKQG